MINTPKVSFKFFFKKILNLLGIKINKKIQEIFKNTKYKSLSLDDFISHIFLIRKYQFFKLEQMVQLVIPAALQMKCMVTDQINGLMGKDR